jgi:predicted dehydrogenase
MTPIRYGLIGAGMMGQEHIRNVTLLDGAEVTAVADPDTAMRATAMDLAGPGAKGFAEHRALIEADICDAFVLAAPNDLHDPLMRDLLATGLPILCEKPLTTDPADARRLMDMAARSGTPVWVAMEYRYMASVARLIAERDAGTIGVPRMLAIREHRYPFLDKVGAWNRFAARTGGTLVEKCCHFFDLMRLLLQADPVRVYASGGADVNHKDETYPEGRPDILDNAFVVVDFPGGTRAMLDLCMFAEGALWQERITLTGELAQLEARVPGPARFAADGREPAAQLAIARRAARREEVLELPLDELILAAGDHHGSTFFQHQKFLEMIRAGGEPEVTLEDGWWAVLMGAAAERSVITGAPVEIASFAHRAAA